jgi:hypothetical protein
MVLVCERSKPTELSELSEKLVPTFADRGCREVSATDHIGLYGLAVRVPGYKYKGPGSIPGAIRFSEKQWVWNGVHSTL